jgi:hypothetical protein
MLTRVDLSRVSRRDLRYVLICLKNGTEIVKQEHQDVVPAVEAFLTENSLSIADFSTGWDIGIDTIDTMHMRPESWWLWGISHLTVVPRPSDSANIAAGFELIFSQGFGVKGRKVPFDRSDYSRMLEGASTRKGWV